MKRLLAGLLAALLACAPAHAQTLSNPHYIAYPAGATTRLDDAVSTINTTLPLKAPLASPLFTGDPRAPTPSPGDNDTSVATSAFVAAGYQPLDSDLTSIAALTTTTYGRSLLTQTSAATLANSLSASDFTTGTLQAARMPALTGDVTTTAGTVATSIGANRVTLAQMAQVATATFLGRTTASTGNVEALTVTQAKGLLNLSGTNSGDQTITLTGDVTGSGAGSFAATIGSNKVTLAQMATVATATFLGRTTAATGNVEALTTAQAKTLLNLTGTNTGDQTITLTGDVTGSGTASFAATLAAAQPAVHTWAAAQTFTVAPVFTDQSGSRTALGLGTLATQSGTFSGTSSGTNTGDQTLASLGAQGTASKDVSGGYPGLTTGTWVPTFSLASAGTSVITYTTQTGTYSRIGDWVTISFRLVFTVTKGTAAGIVQIGGLPVTLVNITEAVGTPRLSGTTWVWPAGTTMVVLVPSTGAVLSLIGTGSGVATTFTVANLTDGASHTLIGTLSYKV